MGFRDVFEKAAQTAVAAFGDVAVSTNYHQFVSTTYDASADTQVAVYATVGGVSLIFDNFEFQQIDGENIRPTDKKALLPQKNISAVTPKTTDRILQEGVVWNIVSIRVDPAGALYELQVRRS